MKALARGLPLLVLLVAAGCGRSDLAPEPGDPPSGLTGAEVATTLLEHYGGAEELDAEIYLLIAPPGQDHVSFSLQLVITPEQGVVLDAFKKGFEILDGHLAPDDDCLLVLQREDYAVRGNLAAIAAQRQGAGGSPTGLFVTQLPRLVDELQYGPVPRTPQYQLVEYLGGTALRCIAEEGEALVVLDPSGQEVAEKIIYRGHGDEAEELIRLRYRKHLRIDGLLRPRLAEASLPGDETRIIVKLSRLARPTVAKPLTVTVPTVPEGWPVQRLGPWLDHLAAEHARGAAE